MPNETETIAKLALDAKQAVQVLTIDGPEGKPVQVVAIPTTGGGFNLSTLKPVTDVLRTRPERKSGTATMLDVDSFIAHVNRHKDESSAAFLNPDRANPRIQAVLDYHRLDNSPRFGTHRSKYAFPLSDEWKAWIGQNGKAIGQVEFAAWIEDHILDLMDPASADDSIKAFANKLGTQFATPSTMVGLSRGLSIYAGHQMTKVVNLASGEGQMTFVEEHRDAQGAPLKIPGAFVLAIPVFKGAERFQIAARLRYRVSGGAVSWFFELYQPERIFDAAISSAAETIQTGTALPLFVGDPEA